MQKWDQPDQSVRCIYSPDLNPREPSSLVIRQAEAVVTRLR
jgi:hypothetical protein